ncbi:hypothetical protein CAPTEDRAFT_175582 [Capitella teleta]|uniref:Protein phosphatase 1L n=1 Tax=Capitella teleta TaxID=283909 RepID=R7UGW4_CAPTE|nr:hypothetical protein CAPTEDRAFT_175582 [Capitella teleta]|eukprot:ELU03028.1 hypothetical protein CAPTEDRAFT_175582 [Capitella teleta]
MGRLQWLLRNIRRYFLNPEAIILTLFFILLYYYFFHSDKVWNVFERVRVRLELKWAGQFDRVPSNGERTITSEKSKASWELIKDNVGVYAIQGRRPHMEDRFNVITNLEHTNTSIYGIFDGHGGDFAADFTEKTLFKTIMVRLLKAALAESEENLAVMLTEEILHVDEQLLQIEKSTKEISGTTCLVALQRHPLLYVANVGDSRGVLCDQDNNMVPLSFDHKPHQLRERKRIRKAGGFISFNGVWRVAGVLATSRALGDYPLKDRNFVIAEPDILTFNMEELKPRFMILATDGLWDAFSNEEAVQFIRERLDEPHYGAKSIVLQAYYRGSLDNITVIIINFEANRTVEVSSKDVKV